MCSIGGFFAPKRVNSYYLHRLTSIINQMLKNSSERGRDSFGYAAFDQNKSKVEKIIFPRDGFDQNMIKVDISQDTICLIANNRAEPETEYIREELTEKDIQPFSKNNTCVVHNGLVSNDRQLREKYGDTDSPVDSSIIPCVLVRESQKGIESLEGSFALAAYESRHKELILYRDFNPLTILFNKSQYIYVFTSFEKYFRDALTEEEQVDWVTFHIAPYTGRKITAKDLEKFTVKPRGEKKEALIVCSGGLDSVVVASKMKKEGYKITLIYFKYGSRAENREIETVKRLAEHYDCKYEICDIGFLGKLGGSSLTDDSIALADGKEGAEHAKDWVPARNTVLISIAAAYADRFDFDAIALGLNLSEGASFMDNTTEYFEAFDHVLDLGTMARPKVICPLSNMMKHELVRLGMEIDPKAIEISYSCYSGNEKHCGKCASCYLRKNAFTMANLTDPVEYE